jgi:hypothetical protein
VRVGAPRLVALDPEGWREAVALLAELLSETAAKRRRGVFGGASPGALGGAMGSVVPFPERPRKARRAA